MQHRALHTPSFHREGISLIGCAIMLFVRNAGPLFCLVAIVAIPVEFVKNYYFIDGYGTTGFFPLQRIDGITQVLFLCAITPMVVHFLLGRLSNEQQTLRTSIVWGLRKWTRMIVYGFVQNVIIFAGLILFIVPGLLYMVRLMLMPIVVAVEHTSTINPIEVSREMARGRYFRMAGYGAAGLVMVIAISAIVEFVVGSIIMEYWIYATVVDVLFDWFMQLFTIILLLVYLQIRTENPLAESAALIEEDKF